MRGDTLQLMADEVRSELDEENISSIEDETDILPMFNRAQTKAYEILARVYPQPVMEEVEFTFSGGERTFELPEHLLGDRLKLAQWEGINQRRPAEIRFVSAAEFIQYRTDAQRYQPRHAKIVGRTVELSGAVAAGSGTLKVFVVNEPNPLVLPFAKILRTSGEKLFITNIDDDYDVTDGDNEYLNIVDGGTGTIKGTVQILTYNETDEIEIKTVPDYTTVLDRTVSGSLSNISISRDDYLCNVRGGCVLQFPNVTRNFIMSWAVAKLKRNKLGAPYSEDDKEVKKFEADLRRAYMARPQQTRIRQTNRIWKMGKSIRRLRSISRI